MMIRPLTCTCALLLAAVICIAGCSTVMENHSQPVAGNNPPIQQPEQMILIQEEIPCNCAIIESREKNGTEMSELARDLGWKSGYVLRYRMDGDRVQEPTVISQNIAVYPADKIPVILQLVRDAEKSQQQYVVIDLPDPGIGDLSNALVAYEILQQDARMPGPALSGVSIPPLSMTSRLIRGQCPAYYEIVFARGEVVEVFRISGPSADYLTLRGLAQKAYRKV
jgi:hypothetical protein